MKLLPIGIVMALAVPAAAGPPLAGTVLVWADAPLYLDPATTAPRITLGVLAAGRDHAVGSVVPMHVVGAQGDFVEVEPTATSDCAWWKVVRPAGLASLHLFVARADLAPVVTRAFTAAFPDGSRIALQPGVAALADHVAFYEHVLPVAIPAANVGLAYASHRVAPVPAAGTHAFLIDEHTDATLGGQPFAFGPWMASAATRRGDRMLVQVAVGCIAATVSVPAGSVQTDVRLMGHIGLGGPGQSGMGWSNADRYYLPAGAPLTSATGSHVVATPSAELDVVQPTGTTACVDFVVAEDQAIDAAPHLDQAAQPDRTLHLCAPAAAVKVERRSRY